MPILAAEDDLFPADLLSDPPADTPWWVVYTMSRREKDLMRRLKAASVAYYGPIVETRKRSPAGRVRTSYLPLFTNYVFLCGDDDARHFALTTGCVSAINPVNDADRLVADLREVAGLIASGQPVQLEEKLTEGQSVRVKTGPLRGREGTLVRVKDEQRLLVAVDFLQVGVSVELDSCDVEPM